MYLGNIGKHFATAQLEFIPWIPVAIAITILCLSISCLRFGQANHYEKQSFNCYQYHLLFIPWTLLPLRIYFQWALDYADIMIPCYAVFMIFSGGFTIFSYVKAKAQNNLMKVCLIVNSLYAVLGVAALGLQFTA